MQVVFQDPFSSLNPRLSVRDILAEPIRNFDLAKSHLELESKVAALMDTVGGMVVATHLTPYDRTATHSFNINYTSFVREKSCRCIGRLLAMARNVATVEIEVVREDGALAAKALGAFGIFRNKNRDPED